MIPTESTLEMLKISSNIVELFWEKDEMDNGDFQGAIEAQIMLAREIGLNEMKKELKELQEKYYELEDSFKSLNSACSKRIK